MLLQVIQEIFIPGDSVVLNLVHSKNETRPDIIIENVVRPSQNKIPLNISVFGLGYVGAVTSVCFAGMGHQVTGIDLNLQKVEGMNNGITPIVEKGLSENLALVLTNKCFTATTDAVNAVINSDISLVSVCTPSHDDGGCNIDYLKAASKSIGEALALKDRYHLILYRSTVPPGTTRQELIPAIEKASGKKCGPDFGVCFNPEFLRETTAIEDFHQPPKTVIGASDEYAARMTKYLYQDVSGEIFTCSIEAAEFVKYVDNTWHGLKVCFGNEVGRLCKASNVDSHEVMDIFCQDRKLNISSNYLMPGFAFGGSCLPKDIRGIQYLAENLNLDLPLINSLIHSNNAHITHAVDLIRKQHGKKIGILGLTFKSGTDDMRESPVFQMIEQLKYMNYDISVHDENLCTATIAQGYGSKILPELPSMKREDARQLCEDVDIIVVAHHTPQYQNLLEMFSSEKPVIDLVRLSERCHKMKDYQGVCW